MLQRHTCWLIINPVTAERVDPKTGDRIEKSRYHRTATFEAHTAVFTDAQKAA